MSSPTLNRFERIIVDAQVAVCIVGEGDSDFTLIDAREMPPYLMPGREDGFDPRRFVGVAGIVHGRPDCALNEELDEAAFQTLTDAISRHFAQVVLNRMGFEPLDTRST